MKKSFKKAQGLSMETIIIAALGLIVLVILVLIFTGNMGRLIPGLVSLNDCSAKGKEAKCVPSPENCKDGQAFKTGCPNEEYCCIPKSQT